MSTIRRLFTKLANALLRWGSRMARVIEKLDPVLGSEGAENVPQMLSRKIVAICLAMSAASIVTIPTLRPMTADAVADRLIRTATFLWYSPNVEI